MLSLYSVQGGWEVIWKMSIHLWNIYIQPPRRPCLSHLTKAASPPPYIAPPSPSQKPPVLPLLPRCLILSIPRPLQNFLFPHLLHLLRLPFLLHFFTFLHILQLVLHILYPLHFLTLHPIFPLHHFHIHLILLVPLLSSSSVAWKGCSLIVKLI